MKFASIGSGSRGNALVVSSGKTTLMIDCGLSLKLIESGMKKLGMVLGDLNAVFITHEHSDHIKGLGSLLRRSSARVFMSEGTAYAAGWHEDGRVEFIRDSDVVEFGSLQVLPVIVPHDAREPCQYVVSAAGKKLGVLTDLGSSSAHVVEAYRQCDALVLECNHDVDMLRDGRYPPSLKARVLSRWGHLSNQQARELFEQIGSDSLQWLVLAHISQQNNCVELARSTMRAVFPFHEKLLVADQDNGFDWLAIG